jgi:RNA polymerase sigma-70 factor, ECF subfamily
VDVHPELSSQEFDQFVEEAGRRLRQVMSAQYGIDIGAEATDASLAWAWEHWGRLSAMANPGGYLYRVAQTQARRSIARGRPVTLPAEPPPTDQPIGFDGDLADALRRLPERQRLAVVMVHAYGWTPSEISGITDTPAVTIRSHLRRGLRQLRNELSKGPHR